MGKLSDGLPTVLIQPSNGETNGERFLRAVEQMVERSNVLQRDGVVISLETPELRADGGSTTEELPLPGPVEGTEVTAVDAADGERCCFRYPGIMGQCTADADVVLTYEGENVYNSPSEAPYCEEHVDLPDWIWERLEEQQLVTDGGTEAREGPRDDEVSLNDLNPIEAEEYGCNEVTHALETVEAGDILELRVSFMSEAAGVRRDMFRMRVVSNEPTEYDTPYRINLEFPSRSALWSPPKHGDWYITGGTAKRESSRVAYSIDSLKLWRRSS